MSSLEKALQVMKEAGYKSTGKRHRMLEILYETDGYLSAKDIQKRLNEEYKNISPDTIYRNLHMFVRLNIAEQTEWNGEKIFQSMCAVHGHHHHFICTTCGLTKEIKECPMQYYENQLPNDQITSHRFEIFGICENCL